MPATLPPVDNTVLSGMRGGDEQSLERIFRDAYPSLLEEVKKRLDDPAAASRVVEGVFARVWKDRDQLATPETLGSFLHEAVHQGAVREASRLGAIRRFEAREGGQAKKHEALTVDQAWAHVAAALHAPAPGSQHDAKAMAAKSRHDTASHMAGVGKTQRSLAVGVTVVVLGAAIGGASWYFGRGNDDMAVARELSNPDARNLSSAPGQIGKVSLDDGSTLSLAPESKIKISPQYGNVYRAVKLEGAASFTVVGGKTTKEGKPIPFVVKGNNATVSAIGTVFSVRSYPGEPVVTVGVREGSVIVRAEKAKEPRTLNAGEAVVIENDGKMRAPSPTEMDESLGWTDGKLVITNRPLKDVIASFTRWYAVWLYPKDTALFRRPVTMSAKLESLKDAIEQLEKGGNLKFGYEGKTMVLTDAAAAPAKPSKPSK